MYQYPDFSYYPLYENLKKFYEEQMQQSSGNKAQYYCMLFIISGEYFRFQQLSDILDYIKDVTDDECIEFLNEYQGQLSHYLLKARIQWILYQYDTTKYKLALNIVDNYNAFFEYVINNECNIIHCEFDIKTSVQALLLTKQIDRGQFILDAPLYIAQLNLNSNNVNFGSTHPLEYVMDLDTKAFLGKEYYNEFYNHLRKVIENPQFVQNTNSYLIFSDLQLCAKRMKDKHLQNSLLQEENLYLFSCIEKNADVYQKQRYSHILLSKNISIDERHHLIQNIAKYGKEIISQMKPTATPIPDELQQQLNQQLEILQQTINSASDLLCALYYVVYNNLISLITLEKWNKIVDNDKNSFTNLIAHRVLYLPSGHTVKPLPMEYDSLLNLRAWIVLDSIMQVTDKFEINEFQIIELVTNCPLIPPSIYKSTSLGIVAALRQEFLSAMRYLVFNTETLIKNIADNNGITTKHYQKGQDAQDKGNMSEILENKKIHDIIGEDIAVEFSKLLFSEDGVRYRHLIAHGILDDDTVNHSPWSINLVLLWLRLIYKMC